MSDSAVMRVQGQTSAVALPTNTMTDLVEAGKLLAQSGMFGISNDAAGFVVMAQCLQQGISVFEFHRTYHLMKGKPPAMRADAMLAALRNKGAKHKIIENSVNRAAIEIEFEGVKQTFEFTMEDARRTGDCFDTDGKTLKYNWQRRQDDMLWARCISRATRRICPEINCGLYPPEEVEDFKDTQRREPPAPITPQAVSERTRKDAKTITVEPVPDQPAKPEPQSIGDCTTCPDVGVEEFTGVPWSELDTDVLWGALESDNAALRPGHKASIRLVLEEREKGGAL